MTKIYYRCSNDLCGKRYTRDGQEKVLKTCPACQQSVVKGIDIIDAILGYQGYILLEKRAAS